MQFAKRALDDSDSDGVHGSILLTQEVRSDTDSNDSDSGSEEGPFSGSDSGQDTGTSTYNGERCVWRDDSVTMDR